MKFKNHLLTGLVLLGATQILLYLVLKEVNITYFILSSVFFILGTVLPDIDLQNSKVHKAFRFVLYPFSFVLGFYFVYPLINSLNSQISVFLAITFPAVIILSYEFVISKKGFKHRGFLHSLPAAVLYGFLVFLISMKFNLSLVYLFSLCFLGFFGWYVHEMTDKIWSIYHKK